MDKLRDYLTPKDKNLMSVWRCRESSPESPTDPRPSIKVCGREFAKETSN